MNEQTILLIFLVASLAVTLGLYFLKANSKDGVYLYFSIDITACREIPTFSAKSACVQSLSARKTLILFHIKVIAPLQNIMY